MVTQRTKWLLFCCTLLAPTAAVASPTYTVTDLGSGGYNFPFTPASNGLPADWAAAPGGVPTVEPNPFPPVSPIWPYDENGIQGYSRSSLVDMNANGLAVGVNLYGGDGTGYHVQYSEVFAVQRQQDGSWGDPQPLWSGAPVFLMGSNGLSFGGISNTGQILGAAPIDAYTPWHWEPRQWWIYDSKDHSSTKLDSLLPGTGWTLDSASIDADGRILASIFTMSDYQRKYDYLLLTPAGDPAPVPEPTALALFVAAGCGGMLRRRPRLK